MNTIIENHKTKYMQILSQNPDKIHWEALSFNPAAIHILEQNLDKISWNRLSKNPAAIHILTQNLDKINWTELSDNESIYLEILKQNIY